MFLVQARRFTHMKYYLRHSTLANEEDQTMEFKGNRQKSFGDAFQYENPPLQVTELSPQRRSILETATVKTDPPDG